jgi:hypothetical protein
VRTQSLQQCNTSTLIVSWFKNLVGTEKLKLNEDLMGTQQSKKGVSNVFDANVGIADEVLT